MRHPIRSVNYTKPVKPTNEWHCQECGRGFGSTKAAERASSNGCPKCGGTDIDVGEPHPYRFPRPEDFMS